MGARQLRLVGRDDELAICRAVVERAATGPLATVVVEAEAGGGKTRLLDECVETARVQGFCAHVATAEPFDESRPFGILVDALGLQPDAEVAERRAVARLLRAREHAAADSGGVSLRVLDSLLSVLERLTTDRPALLVLDDLHWADPSSLVAVGWVAAHAAHLPVALMLGLRPVPHRPEVDALMTSLDRHGATRLALEPLHEAHVVELARARVIAEPSEALVRELRRASGNPLFVLEILDDLERQGALEVVDGLAHVHDPRVASSLPVAIARRVSEIPGDVLELLRLAAVLGSPFSVAALSAFAQRSAAALSPLLLEAVAAGLLHADEREMRFRHDIVRECIYNAIPLALRRRLHYEAGRVLAGLGGEPTVVARHLAEGAEVGDEFAVSWLSRVAESAAEHAPAVAADLFGRALMLAAASDPRRERLVADLVHALVWSGRSDEAEAVAREAIAEAVSDDSRARLRVALVQMLLAGGRLDAAIAEAAKALEEEALSEHDRAHLLAWQSGALLLAGRLDAAGRAAGDVLMLPEADELGRSAAVATHAAIAYLRGELQQAIALGEQAVEIADRSPGQMAHRFHSTLFLGAFLIEADRVGDAVEILQRGRRFVDRFGTVWNAPLYHDALAQAHLYAGRWGDAETEARTTLAVAEDTGTLTGSIWAHSVLAMLALHADELGEAEEQLKRADALLHEKGPDYRATWMLWAQALVLEAQRRDEEALASLRMAWDWVEGLPFLPDAVVLGPDFVRLLLAAGDRGRATAVAGEVSAVAARLGVGSAAASARVCAALVADDAAAMLSAAEQFTAADRPLELAQALESAGRMLLGNEQRDPAAAALTRAHDAFTALGARRDAARVAAALRRAGAGRGVRGPRPKAKEGWESLTETEQRVVTLIGDALTYKEIADRLFISRRTVETHARNIMRKLAVRSRSQLMALLASRRG